MIHELLVMGSQIGECKEVLDGHGRTPSSCRRHLHPAAAVRLVVLFRLARLSQLSLCLNLPLLAVKEKYNIRSFVDVPY